MLQQTQADRVVSKYRAFLKKFPTLKSLSRSSQKEVLLFWQGLGYNRRALSLLSLAKIVTKKYGGRIPKDELLLKQLPGIGSYTAAAIVVFAYNQPAVLIETNIRTAYLYHFFEGRTEISDVELLSSIDITLDCKNPREWYQALMDYGAMLKHTVGNVSRQSKHYVKQKTFAGSSRELRGAIVRLLLSNSVLTPRALSKHTKRSKLEVNTELNRLLKETFIQRKGDAVRLK
jgi:A/G-specific adenine glycosylase